MPKITFRFSESICSCYCCSFSSDDNRKLESHQKTYKVSGMQQIHQLVLFQLIRGIATTPLSSSPVGSMDMKQFTSRPATPEGASRSSSATRSGTTTRVTSVSIVVKYEKTRHVQRMHLKTTVRCSIGWFKSVVEVQKKKGRSLVSCKREVCNFQTRADFSDNVLSPQVVTSLRRDRVIQVSCGCAHKVALTSKGHMFSWGSANT